MDLLETTLKVIENRGVVRENLASFEKDLKQCEEEIIEMKRGLLEAQVLSNRNSEILEINNLTKSTINNNCKTVKEHFALVYNYVQQIEEQLSQIYQQEVCLDSLYNGNEEALKKLEEKCLKEKTVLDLKEKEARSKLERERIQLEETLKVIDIEHKKCEDSWKNLQEEFGGKKKTVETLMIETEILQDKIEAETQRQKTTMEREKEEKSKFLHEIEEYDKQLDLEIKSVLSLSQKIAELSRKKVEMLFKRNQLQQTEEQLEHECLELENQLNEIRNNKAKEIEEMIKAIESNKQIFAQKETEFLLCQTKSKELNEEMELLKSKIAEIDEELQFQSISEDANKQKIAEQDELLSKEIAELEEDSEKIRSKMLECKNEIDQKRSELEELQANPNPELTELEERLSVLRAENTKIISESEKQIEEIDSRNKTLQETVEKHQVSLKELNAKKTQLQIENEEAQQCLKELTVECDNLEKEMKRLECEKQEKMKLIPNPPLKLVKKKPVIAQSQSIKPTVAQSKPVKSTLSQIQPIMKSKRKRGCLDVESDSSVDGERLSYAEFMARKKTMKETRKQKR